MFRRPPVSTRSASWPSLWRAWEKVALLDVDLNLSMFSLWSVRVCPPSDATESPQPKSPSSLFLVEDRLTFFIGHYRLAY